MKYVFKGLKIFLAAILVVIGIMLLFGHHDIPLNELKAKYTNAASSFISVDGMEVHFRDEILATFHLFSYDCPQMSLFADVGGCCVADEFARLAAGEIDVAVIVVLYYLFSAQPELAVFVGGKSAHEVAQFEASLGFYHDAAVHFGYSALMVLEEAECIHPAVSDQHVFLVLRLFGSCIGAFCH